MEQGQAGGVEGQSEGKGMSHFTTELKVSPIGGGRWRLNAGLRYYSTGKGVWIIAPARFTTDFASIPRILWPLYPPYGDTWGCAAVIHDYLYATQVDPLGDSIRRKWADQVFLEALKVLHANWCRRTIMYQIVRWFAGGAWKAHAKRLAAKRTVEDILKEKRGSSS